MSPDLPDFSKVSFLIVKTPQKPDLASYCAVLWHSLVVGPSGRTSRCEPARRRPDLCSISFSSLPLQLFNFFEFETHLSPSPPPPHLNPEIPSCLLVPLPEPSPEPTRPSRRARFPRLPPGPSLLRLSSDSPLPPRRPRRSRRSTTRTERL